MNAGLKGERDAAYEIDFSRSANVMTIHDLRIEYDDRVAQIDHLIINRFMEVLVCESKSFAEGVAINEHGEWTAFRRGRSYGMPSPIAQNERHIDVLKAVFAKGLVTLPKRLGRTIQPDLKSVVLVSNKARIERPKGPAAARIKGLVTVIKVDQLRATIDRDVDERGPAQVVASFAFRLVGRDTAEEFARQLAALHRPMAFDFPRRFGLSTVPMAVPTGAPIPFDAELLTYSSRVAADVPSTCAACGTRVSAAVVSYCEVNATRFASRVLCMRCQRKPTSARS